MKFRLQHLYLASGIFGFIGIKALLTGKSTILFFLANLVAYIISLAIADWPPKKYLWKLIIHYVCSIGLVLLLSYISFYGISFGLLYITDEGGPPLFVASIMLFTMCVPIIGCAVWYTFYQWIKTKNFVQAHGPIGHIRVLVILLMYILLGYLSGSHLYDVAWYGLYLLWGIFVVALYQLCKKLVKKVFQRIRTLFS